MNGSVLNQLSRRDLGRLKSYKDKLDFYHGVQWEGRTLRGEKRLTFNYSKVFIDKIASYLMSGAGFAVDPAVDSPEAMAKAQHAESSLKKVYAGNNLELLELETEIDCAVLGDGCYKVTWDAETAQVRVTAPDVQGIYAWWSGDDMSHIWKIASKYRLSTEEAGPLYHIRPAAKSADIIEVWTVDKFELYLDNILLESKPNPYGFIPFVIFPNLREPKQFWGVSDLAQIMEIQRELNRATSQLSRILELSGNPIAVLENIESSEDIAVRPGAIWNVPEDAKAYLLDLLHGGGVNLHIDYINLLYRVLHDLSESPRAAFGGTERDLSGVALEQEMQPLLQKVARKRLLRSTAYNRRNRMILRLLAMFCGDDFGDYALRMVWSPVLPRDIKLQASSEETLVKIGIHSRRRAMDELGIVDPEMEFRRWLEEQNQIKNSV